MAVLDLGKVVPEKGVDYFTESDINEMVQEVESEINIPKKTSDLTNDSGFIDKDVSDLANYYKKNEAQTKIDSTHKLSSDLVDDTNNTNKFVSPSEKSTWNGKYSKPTNGIPKTDLSSSVQTSLGKADTSLQPGDLTNYQLKPTIQNVTDASATITPADNNIYNCGTLTSLTITNPPVTGMYSIIFTSGSTATTTVIPSSILGLESFSASANTIYEINVLDNRAVVGSWEVNR